MAGSHDQKIVVIDDCLAFCGGIDITSERWDRRDHADHDPARVAMDTARARLVEALRRLDRHGRFRIYCPVTARGTPIYVHAKVVIADDDCLRVGSPSTSAWRPSGSPPASTSTAR